MIPSLIELDSVILSVVAMKILLAVKAKEKKAGQAKTRGVYIPKWTDDAI